MNPLRPHAPIRIRKAPGKHCQRRGTEVIELALILPVLLLIVFSTLEVCEKAFLLQKVKIAAHEGAVVAIGKGATEATVEAAVQDYFDARGVDYGNDIASAVTVSPDPALAETLTPVTVTVSVNTNDNSRIGAHLYRYFTGNDSVGSVTMFKEFQN